MAIIFELFIETREESETAGMLEFWSGFSTTTSDGNRFEWKVTTHSAKHVVLWSESLGLSGIQSYEHAQQMTECGISFAQRLLSAPDFEFARIGIEVDGYSREDFVQEYLEDGVPWVPEGTIISEALWSDIGQPNGLPRFRDGYYWCVYYGESVNPVQLNYELFKIWKQLPGC